MKQYLALGAIALGMAATLPASAATFDFSFANIASNSAKDADDNVELSFVLGANAFITGVSWTVDVTAYDPSWLSELTLDITGRSGEGIELSPAMDVNEAGNRSFTGSVDLLNQGLSFRLGGDGRMTLKFYDAYDDLPGADGRWNSGSLRFDYVAAPVPEPATWATLALGLGALGFAARRQRRGDSAG